MTLVFRHESGSLTQIQIGPADIVATFAAAYAATGWLGGLDGVRTLLSKCAPFLEGSTFFKKDGRFGELFDRDLTLYDPVFHVLTSQYGPVPCEIANAKDKFGGNRVTQIIGLTIAALAHEGGYKLAVELFMQYLAPELFKGGREVLGALHSQLIEDSVAKRLLNEASTLGLSDILTNAIAIKGLPAGDLAYLRELFSDSDDDEPLMTEWHLVAGILRWLTSNDKGPYLTRSGLTARVACYLKTVGYGIGSILVWDGISPRPRTSVLRTVLLVLGGTEQTDPLVADRAELGSVSSHIHYSYNTVGAMLYQASTPYSTTGPEVLQADFESIFESIERRMRATYSIDKNNDSLSITCIWGSSPNPGPIARRLAGIYFPLLADELAPCFARIATEEVLEHVKDRDKRTAIAEFEELTPQILRFRQTTAMVIIALSGNLARDDFRRYKHHIQIEITHDEALGYLGSAVDKAFSSRIPLSAAVYFLSFVHAGRNFEKDPSSKYDDSLIGWREGIYSVLPRVLLDMRPSPTAFHLACRDVFFANLRAHDDGSIHSATTPAILTDLSYWESANARVLGQPTSVIEMSQSSWIGEPCTGPPDKLLYLSLERPLHYSTPDMCFTGRVDGDVVGTVSVLNVMTSIAKSYSTPDQCQCPPTIEDIQVLNVRPSLWIQSKHAKPAGTTQTPAYLAVEGDAAWALFALGQSYYLKSCITTRCLRCSVRYLNELGEESEYDQAAILIGYM